jgi:hypothetical protein
MIAPNTRRAVFLFRAGLGALAVALGYGCGQTAATSADAGDAAVDATDGAMPARCDYVLRDGGPASCPADNDTICPGPDGCNVCRCGTGVSGTPSFVSCTHLPCAP